MGLADEIFDVLISYSAEVEQVMHDERQSMAKEVVKDLKNDPGIPVQSGEYKKGFYIKKVTDGIGRQRLIIANKKYHLTYLLERGHAVHGGSGRTKAYPHWQTAQNKVDTLNERIEETLNR